MPVPIELGMPGHDGTPHPRITFDGPADYPGHVTEALAADAAPIIARYPQSRSALLPLLHLVQSHDGYLTKAGIGFCADQLGMTRAQVAAVATFYSMYRLSPTGDYLVGVCTNTTCAVMGGDEILATLSEHLGIEPGETTADGRITLEHVECNAACDFAPVVMVNWEFFDDQSPRSSVELVDDLRAGVEVAPSRGAPTLCSFRKVSRLLAGADTPTAPDPDDVTPLQLGERTAEAAKTPVLSRYWDHPRSWLLESYRAANGYHGLREALSLTPDEVIEIVKSSGLRGRGGAGFPVGTKWSFIPQPAPGEPGYGKPHYLVVNADESEPGTCKDMPLLLASPHTLVEGMIIASYAIRASHAFIYVRGEVASVIARLRDAVAEAYDAGLLGRDILGSGYDLDIVVHAGAGAYICGEETALLDSLEGRRGQPRLRPPFPAVAGLYASPTVVNNVESIASVPAILRNSADWFRLFGTEKSPGFTLYSLSGHVANPGQYEAPLGITLRELLELAGGMREGHELKFWTPGGSSTPIFTADHLDVPLDYEGVAEAGSMLGTKALQLFDETTCVVRAVLRWSEFYKHESCGKCTPCREGTYWLVELMARLEAGQGRPGDIEKLLDVTDSIVGKAFCALGDAAGAPITSSLKLFRDEYLEHARLGHCPFDPAKATRWSGGTR
ncbi:NADH-quinone oxidoreductase subunit NuoF [Gordonia sp. X0973]|uniref:NADH-quinone oxidoreductase subunit NuoF n=1 Tax=Gordonia sp. X0973 TaxID=2742602 RepID=UPI000F53C373|nr:NADH-quinone oxidoreductase subunit NuoF [Gordonia sp. X0973]QKT08981.1 NADH-quinone oxidoreductase subunit NuoF [Gordonia sp. X0973]